MTSILEREIYSQPEVIARLLEHEAQHIQQIVAGLPAFEYVVIAARGSSDHAATYAQYAWGALGGYPVVLATPSLYTLYQTPPRLTNALVVGVSQSGQSPDIVAVLEEGKRQGRPTIAVTNDESSPLAASADHVVPLHVGVERSVAATKTYTAQLLVMMLFAAAFSGQAERLDEIQRIPQALARTLQDVQEIEQRAERYRYMSYCVVIGRGYNYATSFELSLKLKELTYVIATAYSSADFRHGPIAIVEAGTPAILIMPQGAVLPDMVELASSLKKRQAELIIISEDEQLLGMATTPLRLAVEVPEWLSPITAILPGQVLALNLARIKRLSLDMPRGLDKVTLTL